MSGKEVYKYIHEYVYPILSRISACFALIVILVMIIISNLILCRKNKLKTNLGIYDFKLVNRLTLRLQTAIACYDLWLHTLPLWARPFHDSPSSTCTFIAWMYVFFPVIYVCLNLCIGINLQLLFLHNKKIENIEKYYWIGIVATGLLFSIPPLAMGKLGWSENNGCFTTDDDHYGRMFDFFAITLIHIIAIVYLSIVSILVVLCINNNKIKVLKCKYLSDPTLSDKAIRSIRLLAYRILLYPLIMIITHSGMVVSQTFFDFNLNYLTYDGVLESWSNIGGGILGTLNCMAFFCDPTVHSAFFKIYKGTIGKVKFVPEGANRNSLYLYTENRNENIFESLEDNSQVEVNILSEHELYNMTKFL